MPRFVLLHHDCPPGYERPSHWDLMFEVGDKLHTWALAQLPRDWQADSLQTSDSNNSVVAKQLADHRLAYLDYEGPVSGDRGSVTRVDAGTYDTEVQSPETWQITLNGQRIRGRVVLRRLAPESLHWTLST